LRCDRTKARLAAVARARPWLESLDPVMPDASSLRGLGLMCCANLAAGTGLYSKTGPSRVRLPPPARFVAMERTKLVALCNAISRSFDRERPLTGQREGFWSEMFGAVAQSYARVGDISTTAALLRSAAQLGLSHIWLAQCEGFLLDQQAPEGNFGLITRELALVRAQSARGDIRNMQGPPPTVSPVPSQWRGGTGRRRI
jgi:hypothetical protein